MSKTPFRCRIKVFEQHIRLLSVFVWELEPLDEQTKSARKWIMEHIEDNYKALFSALGIKDDGGWEAVFVATMNAVIGGPHQEYGEWIELVKWQAQVLPSEEFE